MNCAGSSVSMSVPHATVSVGTACAAAHPRQHSRGADRASSDGRQLNKVAARHFAVHCHPPPDSRRILKTVIVRARAIRGPPCGMVANRRCIPSELQRPSYAFWLSWQFLFCAASAQKSRMVAGKCHMRIEITTASEPWRRTRDVVVWKSERPKSSSRFISGAMLHGNTAALVCRIARRVRRKPVF